MLYCQTSGLRVRNGIVIPGVVAESAAGAGHKNPKTF